MKSTLMVDGCNEIHFNHIIKIFRMTSLLGVQFVGYMSLENLDLE